MTPKTLFLGCALLFLLTTVLSARPMAVPELEAHIRFLADPKTEGRGLGSQGLDLAALYLESQFREAGLKPAFSGSYRQPFELLGSTPDAQASLDMPGAGPMTYGEDFVVFSNHHLSESLSGELVYGGYLIQAPERAWDDIEGVDLKGKILLVEVNEPGNREGGIFEGPQMTYYGRWTYKYEQAARLGAKGVLLVHNDTRATYGWGVVKNSWSLEGFTIPEESLGSPLEGWVTEDVAKKVVAQAGLDYEELLAQAESKEFRPVPLGVDVQGSLQPTFRTVQTANVGALLPASGPSPEQAPTVVVTAHYDHIGQSKDGNVYNGVVDNTSATATLLVLARHFSEGEGLPLNLLFVAVSAEEQGLWGSRYFVAHPPLPVERIWANINLEMTNIWGPTEDVYAIGADQSDLDEVARQAAENMGLRYIEELDKENGFFFRSDQFSFARIGVPGLWPHEGPTSQKPGLDVQALRQNYRATHYHQTSDSVDVQSQDWDLEGTLQMAEWVAAMIEILAARNVAPKFLEGSAFER